MADFSGSDEDFSFGKIVTTMNHWNVDMSSADVVTS